MNIQSLLNSPNGGTRRHRSVASPSPPSPHRYLVPTVIPKRQKLAKDAPVFSEGKKIVGHVNYPPHEADNDRDLEAQHRKFRVYPLGQIQRKGVRHIPYNSDKKDLFRTTGREAFEVFQYTYKKPGEDREYVVLWDYNVGLVRMTPFFKSLKHSKTVPAKALKENPGMKDISYSITGGALVCQGYWMPFQASKAIAATFCWDIRFALTPVFGNDFPHICIPPYDPQFAKFAINPEIVRFCTAETARIKKEGASYRLLQPKAASPVTAPAMPTFYPPAWEVAPPGDVESGYGTDAERRENAVFSPEASPRCQSRTSRLDQVSGAGSPTSPFTTYSSALCSPAVHHIPTPLLLPISIRDASYSESFRTKRTHSKVAYNDDGCGNDKTRNPHIEAAKVDAPQVETTDPLQGHGRPETHSPRVMAAAEALMAFSAVACNTAAMQVAVLPSPKRTCRSSRC